MLVHLLIAAWGLKDLNGMNVFGTGVIGLFCSEDLSWEYPTKLSFVELAPAELHIRCRIWH